MKIAWVSNAPMVGSGYGVQSGMFGQRIAALGHDVAFIANWGVQGWTADWQGFRIYPADGEWGNRTMVASAAHHGDGLDDVLVIALCDAWVLNTSQWPSDLRIALWAPVDHWPLPSQTRSVLAHRCVTPIAMSRFGERMMVDAGLEPLYVPHGVDTDLFRPRPAVRQEIRDEMSLPEDAFVVGIVAANQGSPLMHRKAFPQAFQAFARFRERHRDAVLYVHSNEHASGGSGIHLRQLAHSCGIPRQAVKFTDVFTWELGLSRESLAGMYCGFDVLLNAAMGEGFGVPIIEAQACGVPVVVSDHSAMTELCGAGWTVGGMDWYDGAQDAWLLAPSVDEIMAALDQAYDSGGSLASQAREFALTYAADRVLEEYWKPALDALGVTLTASEPLVEVGPLGNGHRPQRAKEAVA